MMIACVLLIGLVFLRLSRAVLESSVCYTVYSWAFSVKSDCAICGAVGPLVISMVGWGFSSSVGHWKTVAGRGLLLFPLSPCCCKRIHAGSLLLHCFAKLPEIPRNFLCFFDMPVPLLFLFLEHLLCLVFVPDVIPLNCLSSCSRLFLLHLTFLCDMYGCSFHLLFRFYVLLLER